MSQKRKPCLFRGLCHQGQRHKKTQTQGNRFYVILNEVGEGRKRKWEVQWDDQSRDLVSTRSLRRIAEPATQNPQINAPSSEIPSANLGGVDRGNSAESDDDSLFDVEHDRSAENEVEPEAYLEESLLT